MNIPQLRITVPVYYRCPSHFQLIGCQPSRMPRLFRNYCSNPIPASQSLCASSQSSMICQHLSSSKILNSKSLKHQSCIRRRDVPLPISLEIFQNQPVPSHFSILPSVNCLTSPVLSIESNEDCHLVEDLDLNSASCDTNCNLVKELDSYSAPSKIHIGPQSNSLGPYLTSSIPHKTNSSLKRPFLKTQTSGINTLRHLSFSTHFVGVLTSQPIKSSPIHRIPSKDLSLDGALTFQPIKSSLIPSRHFSLDGFYITMSQSPPIQTAQSLLLDLHQWLPWWMVIPVATLAVRSLVVLPLAVVQAQVVSRLAGVNAEMARVAPELNKEVVIAKKMYGWDEKQAKKVFKIQLRQIYQRSIVRDNCHPFKMVLLVAFQIPLWVCLSVSLRNLTAMANAGDLSAVQLKCEGLLWFPDLTSPDLIFIPLLLLLVNLSLTEVHALRQMGKGGLLQKVMLNGSRVIIFVVAAAATFNPTSVTFYWLCSSTFGLGQSLLLMSPRIRRSLGIPKMVAESATPYQDIAKSLKKRLGLDDRK